MFTIPTKMPMNLLSSNCKIKIKIIRLLTSLFLDHLNCNLLQYQFEKTDNRKGFSAKARASSTQANV